MKATDLKSIHRNNRIERDKDFKMQSQFNTDTVGEEPLANHMDESQIRISNMKEKVPYNRGDNPELDKRYDEYLKMRIWSGTAHYQALREEEVEMLVKLWRKEYMKPSELGVDDVSELTDFARRIKEYRNRRRRSKARIRKVRSRDKLEEAVRTKTLRQSVNVEESKNQTGYVLKIEERR